MGQPCLADLKPGEQVEGVYLLTAKQILTTKNGKPYGSLRLGDSGGQVDAKLWDRAEELLSGVEPGQAVRIEAKVDVFQGNTQLILNSLLPSPEVDPTDLLPSSPFSLDKLIQKLDQVLAAIKDKNLKRLLSQFFGQGSNFRAGFLRAPAAKAAHHAYARGLLEHTVGVAGMALQVASHYPQLSRDLLLTGALLHDIGKVEELTLGPPLDYTDQGRMIGHVVLGVRFFDKKINKLKNFPDGLADQIRHMILSHHGSLQFGSPVLPATAEALALHFLDDLDAKLAILSEAQKAHSAENGGHWSKFNRLLERFLWMGPLSMNGPDEREKISSPDSPEAANKSCQTASLGLFDSPASSADQE